MKFVTLLLVTVLTYPGYCQWQFQSPYPTGNRLLDVTFIDNNYGWAVGGWGTIIYTSDGGSNWKVQFSDKVFDLRSVYFSDQFNGWVVGSHNSNGLLMHTLDGGYVL